MTMKLIYIRKTASQKEHDEIVRSFEAGKEPGVAVHSVAVMAMHQGDTIPDKDGDYQLLGLWDETDPRKLRLPYRR
jgi:hypothetical protein